MKPGIEIIEPVGILGETQKEAFRQQIEDILAAGADIILIDLKGIEFIDSSGLGVLVVVLKKVRDAKKEIYVCSINDQVRMLFELTSMDHVFDVLPDRSAFDRKMLEVASKECV
ncbi:MAG: STAS domain-containing protein [Leptolyngbya sp. SIO1D8]|nr:STAS domain-containing protein [Leptolyngbya sp. SIO1D8]